MHRRKWIVAILVAVTVGLMVWRVGFYTPEQQLPTKGSGVSRSLPRAHTVAAAEPKVAPGDAGAQPAAVSGTAAGQPTAVPDPNQEPVPVTQPLSAGNTQEKTPSEGGGAAGVGTPQEPPAPKPDAQKPPAQESKQGSARPNVASDEGEALNLKDVEMKLIIQKIADWTGKVVIPTDEIMKQKITIYSPGRLSRNEALEQIYGALRLKGYTAEHADKTIYLKPIRDARIGMVPVIAAEEPLASIENKEQIVQKFFRLTHYRSSQMVQIVQPLIGEYGHINADEASSSLSIIDTVRNLMRIETIIAQFDVAESEQITTEIFEVRNRAPGEIVHLLQILLSGAPRSSGGPGGSPRTVVSVANLPTSDSRSRGRSGGPTASSIVVSGARSAIMLIAEPKFNWVIVKAAAEDMQEVRRWIERLDRQMPTIAAEDSLEKIENKNQMVQRFLKLSHVSPDRMGVVLRPLLSPAGTITPELNTNTLIIIDTVESLLRLEPIVAQFDVPPQEDIATQVFELQHREPEEVITLLGAVLGEGVSGFGRNMGTVTRDRSGKVTWPTHVLRVDRARFSSSRPSTSFGGDLPVVFIAEPRSKWIIVKARPDDMETIAAWIQRFDTAIPTIAADEALEKIANKNQIAQRFLKLTHVSPDRMGVVLRPLLSPAGSVTPELNTNTLIVIDTVESLLQIEPIVAQFDVPPQEDIASEVFELQHREPEEVITLLGAVLGEGVSGFGRNMGTVTRDRSGKVTWPTHVLRVDRARFSSSRPSSSFGGDLPVVFIAEPRSKWIIVKARPDDMETIAAWIQKFDRPIPTIAADDALEKIANKNQIVQRFIKLTHCGVDRMYEILSPMLSPAGRIQPEAKTHTLLIVDTVESLSRLEEIVAHFDVPAQDDIVTQVFELQSREPDEIAAVLSAVLDESGGSVPSTYGRSSGWGSSSATRTIRIDRTRSRSSRSSSLPGGSEQPIILIPDPQRKWIVVKARPEDVELVAGWIQRLDKPMPTVTADQPLTEFENRNQVVQRFMKLTHYDPVRMSEIITPLLTASGHVTVEEGTATLLLIDTVENLIRIESVIAQFDIAEADIVTEIFEVRQRSPEEVILLLETILSNGPGGSSSSGGRSLPASRLPRPTTSRTRFTGSTGGGASSLIVGPGGRTVVLVPEPKQSWIIAKASPGDLVEIRRWIERLDRAVPTITDDMPLTAIENRNQIIQRCIKLQSYSASQMGEIVLPLLSSSGYLSADENTGNLLVIDTVENLIHIEAVVAQFDVPGTEQTTTQVFEIAHADPAEVVQLLRILLSDTAGRGGSGYGGRSLPGSRGYSSGGNRLYRGGFSSSAASAVLMGPSQLPIVLIPEQKRKWIIARASAGDMQIITEWIGKLDHGAPSEREYETVPIIYGDVREVATRINEALQQMPGTELQASVLVQALEQARQVMVFGRQDLREMVKKLVQEIDVPPGQFETKHFQLKYADPDQIKRNIDELFGEGIMSGRTTTAYRPTPGRAVSPDMVKTIAHMSLKQVTVIASPENIKKIGEQIPQWDIAIDVNEVRPRIVELHNSDPAQMATLLKTLFSQEMSSRYSFFDYLFGSSSESRRRIVGPLYGQLTFEQVTGSRKLVVISNVPGAYDVVESLIRELDSRAAAEVPKVVRLNYADPERLSERLNAMFNEPGTTAAIRLSSRGLSDYSMEERPTTGGNAARPLASSNAQTPTSEYRPWWTTGARGNLNQMPISNIIGRVRFIPDTHSKSILVLAPPEFMENVEKMIKEVDLPGKQVMLKAIIMQVDHQNMSSLGVQLSSDASKWQTLDNENALVARNTLAALEQHGSLVLDPKTGVLSGTGSLIQSAANINVLIDFLVRELDAKILNQQTLWTKDNEEAQFFKGQRVGFQTRVSISDTGGRATSDFEYQKVGMTLRARPSITPEKNVDMIINVILSQLTSEVINTQRVRTELDTTTNMVVRDGQTILLGGMLFQEDSRIQRKVPLLGDLPLVGGLFRHKQAMLANSELLIFVTPYVVETSEEMLPQARREIEQAQRKLGTLRSELRPLAGSDEPPIEEEVPQSPAQAPAVDAPPATGGRTKETK